MNIEKAIKIFGFDNVTDIDKEKLRQRYRKLMIKYHPDNPNGDKEKASELSSAKDILDNLLKEIEAFENLMKLKNPTIITSFIPFSEIIDLYNDKDITLHNEDEKIHINKASMFKHNIYSIFEFSVVANNTTFNFTKLKRCEMMRIYNIDCDITVDTEGPTNIIINIMNKRLEVTMNYNSISIPFKFDNDIKVNITVNKKLVDGK